MAGERLTIRSRLERDKDGTWWYVHVPKEIRERLKRAERRGTIPVAVTLGESSWDASLLPWADGSAQLVVKKDVRDRERLRLGDEVVLQVRPR